MNYYRHSVSGELNPIEKTDFTIELKTYFTYKDGIISGEEPYIILGNIHNVHVIIMEKWEWERIKKTIDAKLKELEDNE